MWLDLKKVVKRGAQLLGSQKPNEKFITKFPFLVSDFQSPLHQSSSRIEMCDEDNTGSTTIRAPCPSGIPFSSLSGSRSDRCWGRSDSDEDDIMDVLELTAFEWMKIAIMMSDGWHGPYNVFLKPQDFFLISLQAPDHYFCKMFWSVQFLWSMCLR